MGTRGQRGKNNTVTRFLWLPANPPEVWSLLDGKSTEARREGWTGIVLSGRDTCTHHCCSQSLPTHPQAVSGSFPFWRIRLVFCCGSDPQDLPGLLVVSHVLSRYVDRECGGYLLNAGTRNRQGLRRDQEVIDTRRGLVPDVLAYV